MTVEGNKAAFRRYIEEVWIGGNLDGADDIFAGKYFAHQSDGSVLERSPLKMSRSSLASGAPPSPMWRTPSRT